MFSQVGAESEDLDLLCGLGAGAEKAQVIELAALGGALVKHGVGEAGKMGLAEEAGDHRGGEQKHEPGGENDQADRKGDEGNGILSDAEDRGEEAHSAGGLAAGAVEFVVEDGVLEAGQVEAGGVFHEAYADAIGE